MDAGKVVSWVVQVDDWPTSRLNQHLILQWGRGLNDLAVGAYRLRHFEDNDLNDAFAAEELCWTQVGCLLPGIPGATCWSL
jgi:hypothetical protein